MRALISVYDKTALGEFARGLEDLGFELVASGGTAAFLEGEGLPVTRVEELTEFPELLGGRVKTLHPRIHAGVLARRGFQDDLSQLAEHGIESFDLVCVNLYPFEEVAGSGDAEDDEVIEMIDIGGPALLRGAAKNFSWVTPVSRPRDYEDVLAELRARGETSLETRRRLAAAAFAQTAAYDAAIARWFQDEALPATLTLALAKVSDLAYGENPHQQAAYYRLRGERSHLLSGVQQRQGKELSFNNLNDLSAARALLDELAEPACVIVKHANPCGVAVAETIEEAYANALAADSVSAFGGVVVLNRGVSPGLGEALASRFVEVVFAPGYEREALEALAGRASTRVLDAREAEVPGSELRSLRHVRGGVLVQTPDRVELERGTADVVCGEVDEPTWNDLLFAWRVVAHVTSNAIVLARNGQTIGIGAGQMSRVDAVRIAIEKARELGHEVGGAVLASDAFFPFADGPELALEAGVRAFIHPGGSKRDAEVIEAVSRRDAVMVLTHRRHFRH